jgi:hypothetical protein
MLFPFHRHNGTDTNLFHTRPVHLCALLSTYIELSLHLIPPHLILTILNSQSKRNAVYKIKVAHSSNS